MAASTGTIVGAAIGGFVGLLLVTIIAWLYRPRRSRTMSAFSNFYVEPGSSYPPMNPSQFERASTESQLDTAEDTRRWQAGTTTGVTENTGPIGAAGKRRHLGPARKQYSNDYTGLASLMVENPEKAIVRRFALLNMKNLLYMQAELAILEEELETAVEYDKQFEDTQPYARSWFWLQNAHALQQIPEENVSEAGEVDGDNRGPLNNTMWQGVNLQEYNTPTPVTNEPSAFGSKGIKSGERQRGPPINQSRVVQRPAWMPDLNVMERGEANPRETPVESPQVRPVNDRPLLQRNLVYEIRSKLEKYNKALEQVAFGLGLSTPKRMDVRGLQDWLQREDYGKQFLLGLEKDTWQEKHEQDLVGLAIRPGENDDAFSTAISKRLIVIMNYLTGLLRFAYVRNRGRKRAAEPVLLQWNDSWLLFIVSLLFTTLAASFPVLAILALYKTDQEGASKGLQIGMIGAFSATCAAVLALAKAKRTDVFLATSAFAAVMVVFIKS